MARPIRVRTVQLEFDGIEILNFKREVKQGRMPTCKSKVELEVSASRLWVAIKSGNVLLPKMAPDLIDSIETLEGEFGIAGSVTLVKLGPKTPGGEDELWIKGKVLDVDDENMTLQLAELQGGHIAVGFTKWQPTINIVPLGPNRVSLTSTVEYDGDLDPTIAIALHMEGTPLLFHEVEKYLQKDDF